ncbi:hypothetical protein DRO49_02960 [Candidatus Bathyarchaeota archaeon]|nr:MAG: hypothetical protein DRJ43_03990 [Thermoprotei archaeon]RLI17924.1 MAG: hypothetical protein DRO49_02960 [Candidatus Bathyarchaeota archaeon]
MKREVDRFHKLKERYESGKVSEEEFNEYKRDGCVFELKYGEPPKSSEMRYDRGVREWSLRDLEMEVPLHLVCIVYVI